MIVKLEKETIQEEKLGNKGKFLLQMKKRMLLMTVIIL